MITAKTSSTLGRYDAYHMKGNSSVKRLVTLIFQYPANYIRDVSIEKRFAEYPKLNDLIEKKNKAITESYCPPTYLNADLRTFNLESLKCQFDSIIIDAPLEEYKNTATK